MRKLFTIGYGGRSPQQFLDCLIRNGVQAVVDVRISPRGHLGAFTRARMPDQGIQGLLGRSGIRYFWWEALGNPYRHADDWRAQYQTHLDREWEALRGLFDALPEPYCLLCAEKLAADCHRAYLAERLATPPCEVVHI